MICEIDSLCKVLLGKELFLGYFTEGGKCVQTSFANPRATSLGQLSHPEKELLRPLEVLPLQGHLRVPRALFFPDAHVSVVRGVFDI